MSLQDEKWYQQLMALHGSDQRYKDSKGLSWREIGERLGLTSKESAVHNWLNGTFKPSTLAIMAINNLYKEVFNKE